MAKLIVRHTAQGSDPLIRAKDQLKFYGILLQGLSVRTSLSISQTLANFIVAEGNPPYGSPEVAAGNCPLGISRGRGEAEDDVYWVKTREMTELMQLFYSILDVNNIDTYFIASAKSNFELSNLGKSSPCLRVVLFLSVTSNTKGQTTVMATAPSNSATQPIVIPPSTTEEEGKCAKSSWNTLYSYSLPLAQTKSSLHE